MILKLENSLTCKFAIAKSLVERTKEEYSAELNNCPHVACLKETAGSPGMI